MTTMLDIADVARRTGLTARALRFYEARGLVRPLRTASGRRIFSASDLERLRRIVALKAAGFSLAAVARALSAEAVPLAALIEAQLAVLDARAATLAEARRVLVAAKSRIDRGEPLDAETLCSLIRQGDTIMKTDDWKTVADRYFSPEEQARWAERMAAAPPGFDHEGYARDWAALGTRIAGRLPLDPASAEAQALLDEWQALLAPFTAVATPEMAKGVVDLYDRMPEWQGDAKPPFPHDVWTFIRAASTARRPA